MNKQAILDNLDFMAFYKGAVPSLTGEPQASGKCPFHDDQRASFSVYLNTGLFNCHGCGQKGDVFTFYQKFKEVDFKTALKELGRIAGVKEEGGKKINAVSDYTDENGALLYQVVRYEPKDFRPRHKGANGEWVYNLEGVRRVPYSLPELVNASGAVIVEGEKDAEALKALGYTEVAAVTTFQGGAKGWRPEYADYFLSKEVAIIPDNDKPGLEYAEMAARSLQGKASVLRIVDLPGLGGRKEKHGLDVSDWIALRRKEGNADKEIKAEITRLIKEASPWEPKAESAPEKKVADILSRLESWSHIQALDIKVEWLVDRLIPQESIIVVFGKGGIGKTWLLLDAARSIGSGMPFLGFATIKTPVIYIDFENPLAVLNARTQKLGDAEGVHFWRSNNEKLKAPKLDSPDWELYKSLPKGAVLIFDTLRASQGGDENASNDMGLIMGRLKELRDMRFTIVLLHHTAKNSDKVAKGSTAIVDLSDHIIGLTLVRKKQDGQDVIVDDDDDEDVVYRFGVREKTRFEPHHVYLTLNPDRGFEIAPDPQEDTLKEMHRILAEHGTINKTVFMENCKCLSLGRGKLRRLFGLGQGRYWTVEVRKDQRNAHYVTPLIQSASLPPLYRTEKLANCPEPSVNHICKQDAANSDKTLVNTEFASLPKGCRQTEKLDLFEGEL